MRNIMQLFNRILFKPRKIFSEVSSFVYTSFNHSILARHSLLYKLKLLSKEKGMLLYANHAHIVNTTINSIGQNNRIYINGGGIYHQGNIAIKGNNNKVFVNKDCSLSNLNITIIGNDCIIEIGAGTTTNGTHMYCIGDRHVIRVGKDCMFACGTELWTSDSHSILSIESGEAINIRKHDVVIGDHVWLAEYSKVLKGVTVADNCVIGMCAVLTKSTFPNSLYVGVPANMIKQGITWKR